uniref:PPM-type phosphatase domain-containing protein n=1 Tax=Chenopodium quinoa TaxID=63459 RepID=A0A803KSZ7_CHEQI
MDDAYLTRVSYYRGSIVGGEEDELEKPDNVVVQREEKEDLELWFYGVSDASIGDGISRYLQSNFFDRKLKESLVVKVSKDTMRKAYLDARAKLESDKPEKMVKSASAMIFNGEKIVMAQMGGYRAIVCRDGAMRIPRVRIQACHSGSESSRKQTNSLELIAASERIDSETEFIILASNGIFEVMRNQEAVDLIRHIDDPQEAAECLAREASMRMSRSNISCLVIRFD